MFSAISAVIAASIFGSIDLWDSAFAETGQSKGTPTKTGNMVFS